MHGVVVTTDADSERDFHRRVETCLKTDFV